MAYITHHHHHRRPRATVRLSLPRLAAFGVNLALWAVILVGVQRCFSMM